MLRASSFEDTETYALLPQDNSTKHLEAEVSQSREHKSTSIIPLWMVFYFSIFIVADVVIYMRIHNFLLDNKPNSPSEMPIRYSYIGLDEMYNSGDHNIKPSKYEPIINAPILAQQISRIEPEKVFPVDTHQWLSDYGTLSPPDRNLHVSSDIHTISQFHILDWGMEKCAITVRLPSRDTILPHPYSIKDEHGAIHLDICELDTTRPLNALDLTWRKHPRCIKKMGIINAQLGQEVQLEPFACETGTFKAFEVSCASNMPGCEVDVWTNHNDTWGLYLTQYQTVL